jgi:hypothetical protein
MRRITVSNFVLLYSSCLIKSCSATSSEEFKIVSWASFRSTGLWDNSCQIKSHGTCEEGAPGSEKIYKTME